MSPSPSHANTATNRHKKKIKLRHVSDPTLQNLRMLTQRSSPASPWSHLARHLTLQALALLASLTGTRAGVLSILNSLSPHCSLISTNALDLAQACDAVQLQLLGCLADFVTACTEAHTDSSPEPSKHEPTTVDQILRVLANARLDSQQVHHVSSGSATGSSWDLVVERGEQIVSEWVSTPADGNPTNVVTDEEKRRRREMFDELAEQLSDLMTREYPRLWRHLNDYVDEISITVAIPAPPSSTNRSRKASAATIPGGAAIHLRSPSLASSTPMASAPSSSASSTSAASASQLREMYSTLQPRPPPVSSIPSTPPTADPQPTTSLTDPPSSTSSAPPVPKAPKTVESCKHLTETERQSALSRILTEYETSSASPQSLSTPTGSMARRSAASSTTNPAPFRVHIDRHFPTLACPRVLATAQSPEFQAYQTYAATHVRRPAFVAHPAPWIPPAFSSSGPAPSTSCLSGASGSPTIAQAIPASFKYGGNWTVPPHRRALAIWERQREQETGVSMGYRLTPRGGERNAQVRDKVDELARRVAGVSVEMAAEARALQGSVGTVGIRERGAEKSGGEGGEGQPRSGARGKGKSNNKGSTARR